MDVRVRPLRQLLLYIVHPLAIFVTALLLSRNSASSPPSRRSSLLTGAQRGGVSSAPGTGPAALQQLAENLQIYPAVSHYNPAELLVPVQDWQRFYSVTLNHDVGLADSRECLYPLSQEPRAREGIDLHVGEPAAKLRSCTQHSARLIVPRIVASLHQPCL
eukprot:CAMPEP_0172900732 /NCGR_PEP_ID=MMETSP1075-20121228/164721_1 /TAXON_ID=2916 /ORGANISM="Ceratium fusus, Strain PA161109" /LENGTH=160 /DNA_ID=CAMNT_0013756977 /DNA_START=96 /DNA_END=578 /DNA_ORIENTATION=-